MQCFNGHKRKMCIRDRRMPLIEPLEYKEVKRIKEFVIAIDTSGSVSGELVQKFIQTAHRWRLRFQLEDALCHIGNDAVIGRIDRMFRYVSAMFRIFCKCPVP